MGNHVATEKPKQAMLSAYVGKPVIIEPLQLAEKKADWKSTPWVALVWSDDGEGYQAVETLVWAKAINEALDVAKKKGGWCGGVLLKEGSQFWLDSSNTLIMQALDKEWEKISGQEDQESTQNFDK